jgi:hypothetical protein
MLPCGSPLPTRRRPKSTSMGRSQSGFERQLAPEPAVRPARSRLAATRPNDGHSTCRLQTPKAAVRSANTDLRNWVGSGPARVRGRRPTRTWACAPCGTRASGPTGPKRRTARAWCAESAAGRWDRLHWWVAGAAGTCPASAGIAFAHASASLRSISGSPSGFARVNRVTTRLHPPPDRLRSCRSESRKKMARGDKSRYPLVPGPSFSPNRQS